jgi:hypothetical protein
MSTASISSEHIAQTEHHPHYAGTGLPFLFTDRKGKTQSQNQLASGGRYRIRIRVTT